MSTHRRLSRLPGPLAVLALLVAGALVAPGASAQNAEQTDLEAIKAQGARFSQAYVDNDIETLLDVYDAQGVIGPPNREFMTGHDELRSYWSRGPGTVVVRHRTIPVDIVIEGDVAYDWGRYEGTAGPAGSPSDFSGKYLIVWRRSADGAWRMVQDMWNAGG